VKVRDAVREMEAAMARCSICHAAAPAQARFCPRCGAQLRGSAALWTGLVIGVVVILFAALFVVASTRMSIQRPMMLPIHAERLAVPQQHPSAAVQRIRRASAE
jgi:uncharacterized paraquat-inducible protein A